MNRPVPQAEGIEICVLPHALAGAALDTAEKNLIIPPKAQRKAADLPHLSELAGGPGGAVVDVEGGTVGVREIALPGRSLVDQLPGAVGKVPRVRLVLRQLGQRPRVPSVEVQPTAAAGGDPLPVAAEGCLLQDVVAGGVLLGAGEAGQRVQLPFQQAELVDGQGKRKEVPALAALRVHAVDDSPPVCVLPAHNPACGVPEIALHIPRLRQTAGSGGTHIQDPEVAQIRILIRVDARYKKSSFLSVR